MRGLSVFAVTAAVGFAQVAHGQSGSVDVVRLCLSTVKMVGELSDAMKLAERDSPLQAERVYDDAISKYYDDWMIFSVVLGEEATKIVQENSAMGAVLVASEDCIKSGNCRFGAFDRHSEDLQSKLPVACQQDFRKAN